MSWLVKRCWESILKVKKSTEVRLSLWYLAELDNM